MNEDQPSAAQGAELLPCPFCGGAPTLEEQPAHKHYLCGLPDFLGNWIVECVCGSGKVCDTKDEVIAAWNRRTDSATITALQSQVRTLTEALDRQNGTPCEQIRHQQELEELRARVAELEADLVKEGPLNAENWKLDELIAQLEKWRKVASGKTCVSFENLCFGASSLWHQTHRQNFRAVDRKPDALSRWILESENCAKSDFPAQVLEVLTRQAADLASARAEVERLRGALQAVTEALAEYTDTCEALDAGLAALAPQTKEKADG